MNSTPHDEALLEAALELTDHVPAARTAGGSLVDPASPLDATSRSLDRMALLADVAAAFAGGDEAVGPAPAEPPALFAWGSLRVVGRLGEGAFGEVFLAWDPALQREVALKLRHARAGTLRWLDEARALARVRHPNVLVVHGADLRDDRAGIWTERIRGETLEDALRRRGRFEVREAARITCDIASALAAVHRARVVHGDVTARNIMLETGADPAAPSPAGPSRAVLMDFGTAADEATAGASLGTPLYAAPELLGGASASAASDVYALGVVFFRMLTARWPVEGATVAELRERHARGERLALAVVRRGVPGPFVRIVERALSADPARRFPSAAAMHGALARALGEFVPPVRPAIALIALAGLVALAAVSYALVRQVRRQDGNWFPPPPAPGTMLAAAPIWTTPLPRSASTPAWHVALDSDFDRDGRRDAILSAAGWSALVPNGGRAILYRGSTDGLAREVRTLVEGTVPNEALGSIVACPGDVNGDGWPDAVVGTLSSGPRTDEVGELRLYLDGPSGFAREPAWRRGGDSVYTALGEGIAPIGDVNRDGYADLAVPEHDWTDRRRNQGRVSIYLGSPSGLAAAPVRVLTDGTQAERFGAYVRAAGDVNGDGYADVMIGAPNWTDRRGAVGCVLLYTGGPDGLESEPACRITGDHEGDAVGFAETFTPLGDVDGDGFGDVAIGVTNHSGRAAGIGEVRVHRGGPRGLAPRPVWRQEGYCSESSFARAVTAADIDGDGRVDLVVASPAWGRSKDALGSGAVYVYPGIGPRGWFAHAPGGWVSSDQPGCGFGGLISAGDANGDGAADLLVSAPLWHQGAAVTGREFLFLGVPARRGSGTR